MQEKFEGVDPRSALLGPTEETRLHLLASEDIWARVSLCAHELYERRGRGQGLDFEEWSQAETEILSLLIEQKLRLSRESSKESASNVLPAKLPCRKPK